MQIHGSGSIRKISTKKWKETFFLNPNLNCWKKRDYCKCPYLWRVQQLSMKNKSLIIFFLKQISKSKWNVHDLDPDSFCSGRIQVLDPHQNFMDPQLWKLERWAQFHNGSGGNICTKINIFGNKDFILKMISWCSSWLC